MCLSLKGRFGARCDLSGFLGRVKRRIHPLLGRHAETAGINPGGSLAVDVRGAVRRAITPSVAPPFERVGFVEVVGGDRGTAGPPTGNTLR